MGTWLKRVVYSRWLKLVNLIGLFIAGAVLFISFIGMSITSRESNYFTSYEFTERFISKAGYLRDWIVRYDESTIFTEVTPEEIEAYKQNDGRDLTDEEAMEGIISDRKSYYSRIQNELITTNKNLDYLAIDTVKNRIVTNMKVTDVEKTIDELSSRENMLMGNGYYILNSRYGSVDDQYDYINSYSEHYVYNSGYYLGEKFEGQDNYRIYVALKEELEPGDIFYVGYKNFVANKLGRANLEEIAVIALVVCIICLGYLLLVAGRDKESNEIKLSGFDHIPLEIQCILGFIVMIAFVLAVDGFGNTANINGIITFTTEGIQYQWPEITVLIAIFLPSMAIILRILVSWIKHFKNKSMLEHVGCLKVCKRVYYSKENKSKLVLVVGLIVGINIFVDIFMIVTSDYFYSNFYLIIRPVIWNILCGGFILKVILDYKKVLKGAKEIAEGDLDKKIELEKALPTLNDLATTINSMGTGLEKAVGESIKSERLKTELITNVSHDLKTPLTSIISYIDLLKGETIENETAKEYIGVLDERSHRLKQLVEDLVEASKAMTGNLTAELQMLQLDELVGQAIGEYSDRIEASGLTLVCDKMKEVCVMADGRYMWRMIENLLSNVCKYAMPQTRVYVEVYEEGGYGYFTVKNISKDPLNIDPNELTERFVRGDAARTTEGSGLGLAIAQSLAVIQYGKLDIRIDGDLFKVTVNIPIAESSTVILSKDENE